jgi:F-type H+-transporting ATPase subunit b
MASPDVQSVFLAQLIKAIEKMPASNRAALVDDPMGIEIVTAIDMGAEGAAQRKKTIDAVQKALGSTPDLRFVTDPDLIAGLELRSPHFVLRNSWQADLAQIRKVVKDAI